MPTAPMRLLRSLIVVAGLSLLGFSMLLHYGIDPASIFAAPRLPSPIASDGTIRVRKFGLEQTFIVKAFGDRDEAEHACGNGRFSCRSDLP
jgi:hypothetical protein